MTSPGTRSKVCSGSGYIANTAWYQQASNQAGSIACIGLVLCAISAEPRLRALNSITANEPGAYSSRFGARGQYLIAQVWAPGHAPASFRIQ